MAKQNLSLFNCYLQSKLLLPLGLQGVGSRPLIRTRKGQYVSQWPTIPALSMNSSDHHEWSPATIHQQTRSVVFVVVRSSAQRTNICIYVCNICMCMYLLEIKRTADQSTPGTPSKASQEMTQRRILLWHWGILETFQLGSTNCIWAQPCPAQQQACNSGLCSSQPALSSSPSACLWPQTEERKRCREIHVYWHTQILTKTRITTLICY